MRRIAALLTALWLGLLILPSIATGADVPRLTGRITDDAGVLGSGEATARAALDRLYREDNIQLWVLIVTTTGSLSVTDFSTAVATQSSLGVNDALLVVATGDHTDAMWVSDGLTGVSTTEIDEIISQRIEPRLAAGDWAGAVAGAAAGLAAAVGAPFDTPGPTAATITATPGRTAATGGSTTGGSSGFDLVLGLLAAILILIGLYMLLVVTARRRFARQVIARQAAAEQDIGRQANSLLISTDDAIEEANQEAGFVEAQFGTAESAPIQDALTAAGAEMKAAFGLRQQLDDAVPEDEPTRQRMLSEIVARCQKATGLIDAQTQRIAALRDLQKTAPDVLRQLPDQVAALRARLDAAHATRDRFAAAYAPATWDSVKGNAAEAEKRLDFVDGAIAQGQAAVSSGDSLAAVSSVRQSQAALAEATALLDAIDRLAASLDQARDQLPALFQAAEADLAAAQQAIDAGATPGGTATAAGVGAATSGTAVAAGPMAARMADARQQLAAARAAAAAPQPDVLEAFRLATAATAAGDALLAATRQAQAEATRRQAVLQASLQSAQMSVHRASDFIATRRTGVGSDARTRLTEAQRLLDQAVAAAAADPSGATATAQRAQQLADAAYSSAGADFDVFDRSGQRPDADVAGAIIGGIIGGMLGGGGWRGGFRGGPGGGTWGGGGFGGTPWGSGGSSGRTFGGGFGGFGGGGRSRGGRWR